MKIVISSGHGRYVRGASDIIDEVAEARLVTDKVAEMLEGMGVDVIVFHDNTTLPPSSTVSTIVSYHNRQERGLDVSVHFNSVAGGTRDAGIGVETLYKTGNIEMRQLASSVSKAISDASGLILRRGDGTWERNDLGFLNRTNIDRAVLLEVCFVNSREDVSLYRKHFDEICYAIATALAATANGILQPPTPSVRNNNTSIAPIFTISETNMQAMVDLGIVSSPDYWHSANIQWLNELFENASRAGELDSRIYSGVNKLDDALEVLVDAGIVTAPDYWERLAHGASSVKWLDTLLINMANLSRNVLERIIFAEARGEDEKGQILVGNVIMNRHNSARFPSGIRAVVFQNRVNADGTTTHQFTPVANGAYKSAKPTQVQKNVVDAVLNGADYSQGATFFRTVHGLAGSFHAESLRHVLNHGAHAFFVEP